MKKIYFLYFIFLVGFTFLISSCEKDNSEAKKENEEEKPSEQTKANITFNWAKGWGTAEADDFSGSVVDNNGNLYFTSSLTPDGDMADIALTKINLSSQSLVWSKRLNSGYKDYFPSPSENGHAAGGGGSRCISIDANNNLYIAGTSRLDFNKVFVVKFDADGNILWQKFWGANTSGLANSAAKAYAMDVCNNKVFVTGATGAGSATEEAMVFLLILDATNGNIDSNTIVGIDPSPSYNDRGYTIKAHNNGDVYIGGWEGANNSGLLIKYNYNLNTVKWIEKIALGWAARITDIDFDANDNLYLAVDIRGVNTFMGFMKLDTAGNILWANKIQGMENDRNNVSCVRIINDNLYIGGRGAFKNFDAEFGDGYLVKTDLNGNLLKVYNYFTGNTDELKCGERLEAFHFYNNGLLIAGEAWPKTANIKGEWYIPEEKTITNMNATASKISNTAIILHNGSFVNGNFTTGTSGASLYTISENSKGSADIIIMQITE